MKIGPLRPRKRVAFILRANRYLISVLTVDIGQKRKVATKAVIRVERTVTLCMWPNVALRSGWVGL
jgi:hypothetical protein